MMIKILALVALLAATATATPAITSVSGQTAQGFNVAVSGAAGTTVNVNMVTHPNLDFSFLAIDKDGASVTQAVTLSGSGVGTASFTNLIPDVYNIQVCTTDTPPVCSATTENEATLCTAGGNVTLDLNNAGTSVAPNLVIYFQENLQFTQIDYRFGTSGTEVCGTGSGVGDPTVWTQSGTDYAVCDSPQMVMSAPINEALDKCGFTLVQGDGTATYTATIQIITKHGAEVIRGVAYPTVVTSTVDIKLTFQTEVSASITSLNVIGDVVTLSTITSQVWDATNEQATLTLLTSVQWPYQIDAPTMNTPSGWVDMTGKITPQTADANTASAAECHSDTTYAAGEDCNQYWTIVIKKTAACSTSNPTEDLVEGGWTFTAATMQCHQLFTGGCDANDISTQTVNFGTTSDNYCPNIFTGETAQATLTAHKTPGLSDPANDYVFGSNTYFKAEVTSDAKMSKVRIEEIRITAGAVTNNDLVYSYTPVDFSTTGSYGEWHITGILGNVRTDAEDAAGATTLAPSFTWEWNDKVSSAVGDAAMPTTVQVTMQIQYLNGGQKRVHLHKVFGDKSKDFGVMNAGATSARASVGVSAKSSSSSSTLGAANSMTALVVACALVGLLIFIVVARRRRRKEEDLEVQEEEQGDSVHLALPVKKVEESQA